MPVTPLVTGEKKLLPITHCPIISAYFPQQPLSVRLEHTMNRIKNILHPDDPQLDTLCTSLAEMADLLRPESSDADNWPARQLQLIGEYGVNAWFVPQELGGAGWNGSQILAGYLKLSAACLTTTFIVTQRAAAIRRIVATENVSLRDELLAEILAGKSAATVGISHLTTSRRHLGKPVLRATKWDAELNSEIDSEFNSSKRSQTDATWILDGYTPWVTGACGSSSLVVGAELDDGRQILLAVPTSLEGVVIERGISLVGLSGSQTGAVRFENVTVPARYLLAGPVTEVLKTGSMGATGGSQTSGLAIGLAGAAIEFLRVESQQRPELVEKYELLDRQWKEARANLLAEAGEESHTLSDSEDKCESSANGESATNDDVLTNIDENAGAEATNLEVINAGATNTGATSPGNSGTESLRIEANSLVLRATQAALVAAKGAGYASGHSVGRWCREALFFLVWSCPPNVANANLCELVGLRD